jgi:DNA-binding MarR family transcriptional regulator
MHRQRTLHNVKHQGFREKYNMTVNCIDCHTKKKDHPEAKPETDMTETPEAPWYETVVLPALLRWARRTYGEAMHKALAEAGCDDVPPNGLYVIGGLALGAGDVPLSVLVKELKLSKQAAGQLVDTLVLRGYLTRETDEADRRRFTVALTERGRHAASVQREARERIDAELLGRVGADAVAGARKTLGTLIEMGRRKEDGDDAH